MAHQKERVGLLLAVWLTCARGGLAAVSLQIGHNFTGATYGIDSTALPPDAGLAVGPGHVVEFINGRFSVYTKTNATRVQTKTDTAFWTAAGVSYGGYVSDPRILFDVDSQRWFATMVDVPSVGANHFLLAVSATADPTGTWHGTSWKADPINGYFADFPTLGIDANGVYLSGDLFNGNNSVGALLDVIPKEDVLAIPVSISGLTSSDLLSYSTYGEILQPAVSLGVASSPEAVLAMGDLGYDFQAHSNLISFSVQNANVPNSATLSTPAVLVVPPYTVPINPPQANGVDNLDDGDARLSAMVYRVGDTLYAVHGVQVDNRAAIQWFVVNATNQSLIGTGTLTDPALHLFYPAIAANAAGDVMIAYNACGLSQFISCYAVAAEPINGNLVFGNPVLLKTGVTDYRTGNPSVTSRWGDYSAVTPDPSDPARFWSLTMYPVTPSAWSTEITELIMAPLELTISPAGTNVLVCWPASAAGYQLQSSADLTSLSWTNTPQTPVVSNGQYCVTIPASDGGAFFRLSR